MTAPSAKPLFRAISGQRRASMKPTRVFRNVPPTCGVAAVSVCISMATSSAPPRVAIAGAVCATGCHLRRNVRTGRAKRLGVGNMGRRKYSRIVVDGKTYDSAQALADAVGLSESQVCRMLRAGRADDLSPAKRVRGVPVVINGIEYANCAAAGRALGVSENTVRTARRKGTLHRVGTGRVGPEPMRVMIKGRVFENVREAAQHYGVHMATVWAAIAAGDPDRIARPPVYNPWKARKFKVGGLEFPSMRRASIELGFSNPEYVATAMKRQSKRGMERILSAAMRYERFGKEVSE